MAVIVNGDGILTGISSLATALTDLTSGRAVSYTHLRAHET